MQYKMWRASVFVACGGIIYFELVTWLHNAVPNFVAGAVIGLAVYIAILWFHGTRQ